MFVPVVHRKAAFFLSVQKAALQLPFSGLDQFVFSALSLTAYLDQSCDTRMLRETSRQKCVQDWASSVLAAEIVFCLTASVLLGLKEMPEQKQLTVQTKRQNNLIWNFKGGKWQENRKKSSLQKGSITLHM